MGTNSALLTLVAGGLSGTTVDFILFPLDTIKTRLQTRQSVIAAAGKQASFYKGLLSAMIISFPSAAVFWSAYQASKRTIQENFGSSSSPLALAFTHASAAGAAEICVASIRTPFEVVKQQLQVGLHKSTTAAVRTIIAVDGFRGLYAGYASTIARDVPFDIIQFVLYEHLKKKLIEHRGRDLMMWENMILGFFCGGFSAAVTTPLDVARTRLMTQTKTAAAQRYSGVLSALTGTLKEEGAGALFSGVKPRVAWISLGGAIFMGSFEEYSRIMRRMATTDY